MPTRRAGLIVPADVMNRMRLVSATDGDGASAEQHWRRRGRGWSARIRAWHAGSVVTPLMSALVAQGHGRLDNGALLRLVSATTGEEW